MILNNNETKSILTQTWKGQTAEFCNKMNVQEALAKFHNKYTSHNWHWVRPSFKNEKKLLPFDEKNDWLVHEKGDMLIASLNIYRISSFWGSLFTSPSLRVNNGLTMENKSLCKCKFRFQQYSLGIVTEEQNISFLTYHCSNEIKTMS